MAVNSPRRLADTAAARVALPRCTSNVRFAGWSVFCIFNLVWVGSLIGVLTNPKLEPSFRAGLSCFWVLFGGCCVYLTIRAVRVAVWIAEDEVRVRNYTRSYSISLDQVHEFSFGFEKARMPGYEQAGSVRLKSGEIRPVVALSKGLLFSGEPTKSGAALLSDLNDAVDQTQSHPT